MRAILAIASTTVGEAIRRKALLSILLVAICLLVIAPGLGILSARSETTVLKGMMLGIIQLFSALIAVVLTVYMIPNEIERRTIYTILSKPVQRWQFLVGKYLGAVATLLLVMALMCVILVAVFVIQRQDMSTIAEVLKAPTMYFVQMSLLSAVGIFFSTFVAPLVNFFLSGGLFLLGSLFNPFFQTLQDNSNTPQVAKFAATVVNGILPNFSNYNIQNPIINPESQIHDEKTYYLSITFYGILYIVALLVGGIWVFDRREV